ncbi:GyrI-like domain-containing protein [Endothiovibrio diazotrophicus]
MEKIDLKKSHKALYRPSAGKVAAVEVPEFAFLMIDGEGDPETSPRFAEAAEALFSVSYTAKFAVKRGTQGIDYAVMPLEGLWWADDMEAFVEGRRNEWRWTLMIAQPDFVAAETISAAIETVAKKKGLPALPRLRLERFAEGSCAQTLHVGPFSEEGPAIERLHQFIAEQGAERRGKHHEIYLSDTRRTAPERWKTVLRQPFR